MNVELIMAFVVGMAFGLILMGLFCFFGLFVHHYQKAINESEEIYGDEKNTESDRDSDD